MYDLRMLSHFYGEIPIYGQKSPGFFFFRFFFQFKVEPHVLTASSDRSQDLKTFFFFFFLGFNKAVPLKKTGA